MVYGGFYEIGTASLDGVDDDIVNIVGALLVDEVISEDSFEYAGRRISIAEVISDTRIRLKYDWPDSPFSSVAGGTWVIRKDSPLRNPAISQARTLRDQYERLRIFDQSKPILGIVEFGVDSPPVDYAVNDALVIGASPTGEFVGRSNKIARFTEEGAWFYVTPEYGWHIISESDPAGTNVVRSWGGTEWLPTSGLSAGLNFRGEWINSEDYVNGDVVLRAFKIYVVEGDSTGDDPVDGDPWHVYVLPGEHGGVPIALQFDTEVTAAEPGSGKVKLNNATPGSATILRISKTDRYGGNRAAEIAWIGASNLSTQKGRVRLQKIGSVEDFRAIVTTVTDAGSSYNLAISSASAPNGFFDDDDEVLFYFDWRGDKGEQGVIGLTGPRGLPGGGVAIPLIIDANSRTNSDPGNGILRFNQATQNASNAIYVDVLSSLNASIQDILDSINSASTSSIKVTAQIVDQAGAGKFLAFGVSLVTTATGYRILSTMVRGASSASPFDHGEAVWLFWSEKGDKGDAGTIEIGDVTALESGETPQVINVGTPSTAVLDFALPRGQKGDPLQPWRVVNTLAERDQFDSLSPTLDNGNQRSVLVLADESASGVPSLYFLLETEDEPDPAVWSDRINPTGITEQQLATTLREQPDPVAMAMIYS